MEENINERLSELGTKILATTRNELYIHMRFLDVALSSFAYVIDPSVNGVGTGWNVYVLSSRSFRRHVQAKQSPDESCISSYGASLHFTSCDKKKRKR